MCSRDRKALLAALPALWEDRTTQPLIAATREDATMQAEAMLATWGQDPMAADVRWRTVHLVQIDSISMRSSEDLRTRLTRIPSYVEV